MEFKKLKRVVKRPAYFSDRTPKKNQYSNYLYNSNSAFIRFYAYLPFIYVLKKVELKDNLRVLEIGCADGPFLPTLYYNVKNTIAIDINFNYLLESKDLINKSLRNTKKINLVCSDGQKLPFSDSNFDIVFCLEVLEHVQNPFATINEIHRVLKTDGSLFCTLPIEIGFPLLVRNLAGKLLKYERPYYTLQQLFRSVFLKKTGARPEYSGYTEFMGEMGHKNFDWRIIKKGLKKNFNKLEINYFPLKFLRGFNPFVSIIATK